MTEGEGGEGRDGVDDAVGEVGRGADEQDCGRGDKAADGWEVNFVGWGGARDNVDFDVEVGACFAEGGVGGLGEDPEAVSKCVC